MVVQGDLKENILLIRPSFAILLLDAILCGLDPQRSCAPVTWKKTNEYYSELDVNFFDER